MPSFVVNEWTPIGDGAWIQRAGDTLRLRVEWGVEASYGDMVSVDSLPGGPWRLKGFHVVSDDYMELHFRLEESQEDFNTALMAGVPSKRELLASSMYGAIERTGHFEADAKLALKAADALIAEAAKP